MGPFAALRCVVVDFNNYRHYENADMRNDWCEYGRIVLRLTNQNDKVIATE